MKRKSALLIVLMMLASFTAGAENLRGDVDQDGRVNIADVTSLIDYLLTNDATGISLANADSDLDGRVNIADVTEMIDYLLTGTWGDDPVTPPDEGDWVDLGLPSGTIWATRNVGASSPEDYGDYFAWGETEPKDIYNWETYMWWREAVDPYMSGYTKYSHYLAYYNSPDNKWELDPEDDAACVHYPGGRLPSENQVIELCNSCTWQWTQYNGVDGMLVTGPNGNTMFLPAAGSRWNSSLDNASSYGFYWSRTLYGYTDDCAHTLYFEYSGHVYCETLSRQSGFTARAVRVSQN